MKLKRVKCMTCAFEFYYNPEIIEDPEDTGEFLCPCCNIEVLDDQEINDLYDFSEMTEIGEEVFADKSELDQEVIKDVVFKLNHLIGVPEDGDIDYDKISLLGTEKQKIETLVDILHKLENL